MRDHANSITLPGLPGLEWFGGTADIKHAVVSDAADDSFDWTFSWLVAREERALEGFLLRRGELTGSGPVT